ncbi:unnamed protein product [Orchesella dallaii]|uniref:Gustatory receptor n=1 Tax=Orchesella dallaii TaxID=48710 RepID=A0ABP1S468_9HEXA
MHEDDQTEAVFVTSRRSETVQAETHLTDLYKKDNTKVISRKRELFHWYFLAGYYILIVPYKVKKREGDQVWQLESWWFQKLLCLLISCPLLLASLVTYVARNLRDFYAMKDYLPKHYLSLANILLLATFSFKFQWILMFRRDKLGTLLNNVSAFSLFQLKEPCIPQKFRGWKRTSWILTAYVMYICVHCIGWHMIWRVFFDKTATEIIASGRKGFFLANLDSNITQMHLNGTLSTYELYSIANILVGSAEMVLSFRRQLAFLFPTIFFSGILSVTFWSACQRFQDFLSMTSCSCTESNRRIGSMYSLKAAMIMEKYTELRNLLASLNSLWSTMTLFYVVCKTVELMFNFNRFIESKQILSIFSAINFRLLFVLMLVMLAEGYRTNASIKLWLNKRGYLPEEVFAHEKNELECLQRSLDTEPVGIGRVGLFEINYGFLAQLLVFSVTTFLITF